MRLSSDLSRWGHSIDTARLNCGTWCIRWQLVTNRRDYSVTWYTSNNKCGSKYECVDGRYEIVIGFMLSLYLSFTLLEVTGLRLFPLRDNVMTASLSLTLQRQRKLGPCPDCLSFPVKHIHRYHNQYSNASQNGRWPFQRVSIANVLVN